MTDMETLLRDTLDGRAATVTSGPAWTAADAAAAAADAEVLDLIPPAAARPRRSWRGPAALVAAAAVVAGVVAGVAVATSKDAHHTTRAAKPTATQPAAVVTRSACRTELPGTWREAASAASTPMQDGDVESPMFWGTTPDGSSVVEYSQAAEEAPNALADHVGLISPGSPAIHEVARVTSATRGLGLTVSVNQNLVVIAVEEGINRSAWYSHILAFDARTGLVRTVASVPRSAREQLTGAAYPFDGHVYWETTTGKGWRSERIRDYDMTTGKRTVAARGVFDLESSAAGLAWSLTPWRLDRPAGLPPVVRAHVHALSYDSFVTDGTAYAWVSSDGSIEWWSPSSGQLVRVPKLLARPFSRSEPGSVFAVAGPIVVYQPPHSDAQRVLDVRTGATAPVSSAISVGGRLGQLIGDPLEAGGSGGQIMRLDTAQLPPLHC